MKGLAGRTGFGSDQAPLSSFLTPDNPDGGVLSFGTPGSTVAITPPAAAGGAAGAAVNIPSLAGFIKFLASVTDVNILSTPQIMALDNEEAEIEVGDTVPVGQQTTVGAGGVSTTGIQREDATIKLNIKPHISPGSKSMRLEITQTIKDVAPTIITAQALAQASVTTTKRNAKTNVMVHDGNTIVLGGLMHNNEQVSITKVPLLGDIPILGWLFKGKQTKVQKQNLLMFITPRIVRNNEQNETLLKEKLRERVDFIQKNVGGKDTQGEFIDSLKLTKDGQTVPATGK